MKKVPQIKLKKGRTESIERKHPWVFSGAIKSIDGKPEDGDIVYISDENGNIIGTGFYQQKGSIVIRLLEFDKTVIDNMFFLQRFHDAYKFRQSLDLNSGSESISNAFRFIYGEADFLPGLIIDFYNGVVVIQPHIKGYEAFKELITNALQNIFHAHLQAVVWNTKDNSGKKESEILFGYLPDELIITEFGNKFIVDVADGQKTGFFIDQRENRRLLSKFSRSRKVLNMFCYTGGFTIAALKGGATQVVSVDTSGNALKICEKNLLINGFSSEQHPVLEYDAYNYLESAPDDFDIIILDPPAFAKQMDARHRAVKGYQRLNLLALKKVKKNGFIFTFSCTQVVNRQLFESTVTSAAILSGRKVRIVAEMSHAHCHAYNIFHPEGKYLKGLILYVE